MATILQFSKGHATGNDFILYADPEGELPLTPEQIAALCDRHFGVGADGVIRAVRSANLPEGAASLAEDDGAEWFMDHHNANGFPAVVCGNGIRLYAEFLAQSKLVKLGRGDTLTIGTRGGVRDLQQNKNGFQVDLGRWQIDSGEVLVRARDLPVARPALSINLGNHHMVVALSNDQELHEVDLSVIPQLEPESEHPVNIEFVVPFDPLVKDGVGRVRMRVHEHERGESLSCGSGAAAAALATRYWAGKNAPNHWKVEVSGGTLGVRMFATEDGEHVALSGPAQLVFDGAVAL